MKIYFFCLEFRNFIIFKALTGSATRAPRWQACGDNVVGAMPQVAGRLFAEEYFKEAAKKDVSCDTVDTFYVKLQPC